MYIRPQLASSDISPQSLSESQTYAYGMQRRLSQVNWVGPQVGGGATQTHTMLPCDNHIVDFLINTATTTITEISDVSFDVQVNKNTQSQAAYTFIFPLICNRIWC